MRVLIVEDDPSKAEDLADFLNEEYPPVLIDEGKSFQSGLRLVLEDRHDLILLDMTMTNFDRSLEDEGGRPHHFAGREILRQMTREGIATPVIVVTHFGRFGEEAEEVTLSELKAELEIRFSNYFGTVHYRSNVDDWRAQLRGLIGTALKSKSEMPS